MKSLALVLAIVTTAVLAPTAGWAKRAKLDEKPTEVIKHPMSQCQVHRFGGDGEGGKHPRFKIYKKKKYVYSVECDCWVNVLFSPTGKFIAMGNRGTDSFKGYKELLVYNCKTGAKKTYVPAACGRLAKETCDSNSLEPFEWSQDEKSLKYTRHKDGEDLTKTLTFEGKNAKP